LITAIAAAAGVPLGSFTNYFASKTAFGLEIIAMYREASRAIIDATLVSVGMPSAPAIETNSLLAVTLAVSVGDVCAILPGDMVAAVRGNAELEARPLVKPDIRIPLGFISLIDDRPSRALQAALRLMAAPEWAAALEKHAGEAGF